MAAGNVPKWVWIFTPALTFAFVGFLFYLSTIPAGDDIDKITDALEQKAKTALQTSADKKNADKASAEKQSAVTAQPNNTPAKVEEYEFYKLLENKKVDVPEVTEYKSTPKGTDAEGNKVSYRLRVGSFSSREGADRQKAMLTLNGFDTKIESADVNGKTYYRVFVGPFDNRSKLNKAQDSLVALDIQSMVVKD